jgi:hypothetical protein
MHSALTYTGRGGETIIFPPPSCCLPAVVPPPLCAVTASLPAPVACLAIRDGEEQEVRCLVCCRAFGTNAVLLSAARALWKPSRLPPAWVLLLVFLWLHVTLTPPSLLAHLICLFFYVPSCFLLCVATVWASHKDVRVRL